MNYLAHLHLGGQLPAQLLGSLYGDFVKGRLQGQFSPPIEAASQMQRSIDRFTDSHPQVGEALSRFSLTRRRYAGIVLDVFFDHCLARDWALYAEQVGLNTHCPLIPRAIRNFTTMCWYIKKTILYMFFIIFYCSYMRIFAFFNKNTIWFSYSLNDNFWAPDLRKMML